MVQLRTFILDDDVMMRTILRAYVKRTPGLVLVGSTSCPVETGALLSVEPVDLLFLDIGLPILDGFRFLASLATRPAVVVVSARSDHAAKAFDHGVVDFLFKPFTFQRYLKALERARRSLGLPAGIDHPDMRNGHGDPAVAPAVRSMPQVPMPKRSSRGSIAAAPAITGTILVRTGRRMVEVNIADIELVQSMGNYVKLHLHGRVLVVANRTMKSIQADLPADRFVRIHRSYLIALSAVRSLTSSTVEWRAGHLPMGGIYRKGAMSDLMRGN